MERGSARRSSLKGRERAVVSMTNIKTVSKATFGKLLERRGVAHMGFSERIDTILNGAERIPLINNPADAFVSNIRTVSKGNVRETSGETGWSAYGLFRAHRYHPERSRAYSAHKQSNRRIRHQQRQRWGNFWRDGMERIWAIPITHIPS